MWNTSLPKKTIIFSQTFLRYFVIPLYFNFGITPIGSLSQKL